MIDAATHAGKTVINSKSARDFAKTAGKKVTSKAAEATGDLVGSKIADKNTSLGNKERQQASEQSERSEREKERD